MDSSSAPLLPYRYPKVRAVCDWGMGGGGSFKGVAEGTKSSVTTVVSDDF